MNEDSRRTQVRDLLSTTFEHPPILPIKLTQQLKSGNSLNDNEFDQVLPPLFRFLSPIQWTSVEVAQTLADWLQPYKKKKIH